MDGFVEQVEYEAMGELGLEDLPGVLEPLGAVSGEPPWRPGAGRGLVHVEPVGEFLDGEAVEPLDGGLEVSPVHSSQEDVDGVVQVFPDVGFGKEHTLSNKKV